MKSNINGVLNKLIAFARNNLMLDALDETYVLNRLSVLCGVSPVALEDTDVDDDTPDALIAELKTLAPNVDACAVLDALMPAPHTIDYYFRDELDRNKDKAYEFLFDLYAHGSCVNPADAHDHGGFIYYAHAPKTTARPIMAAGDAPYTPIVKGNYIASVDCDAVLVPDIISYCCDYIGDGMCIAKRLGTDEGFMSCKKFALSDAPIKKQIADGPVKVALLDYPVPVLAFSGIAKHNVANEAARVLAKAGDTPCVIACALVKGSPVFYIVFADKPADDVIKADDALTVCGCFASVDYKPLLSVLEKGTALSTDLFEFKPVYSAIGGVKLGNKAQTTLDEEVVKRFKAALAKAASVTEDKAQEFAAESI